MKTEINKSQRSTSQYCPICQIMKIAKEQGREPTEGELKKAFKEAKQGGAIVGGEWFEKK